MIKRLRLLEHLLHGHYFTNVPVCQALVEEQVLVKHGLHVHYFTNVPISDVLVESRTVVEHGLHIRDRAHVPVAAREATRGGKRYEKALGPMRCRPAWRSYRRKRGESWLRREEGSGGLPDVLIKGVARGVVPVVEEHVPHIDDGTDVPVIERIILPTRRAQTAD